MQSFFLLRRLHDFFTLLRRGLRSRNVDAEWLFRHEVASLRESARPTSHANIAKLAAAALSFQATGIAQLLKDYRVIPDLGERGFFQVTRNHGQIPARIHFAFVRDETNSRAC